MKHGIQIFEGPKFDDWTFIEASSKEQAEVLHYASINHGIPTRRAIETDDGIVVAVAATE